MGTRFTHLDQAMGQRTKRAVLPPRSPLPARRKAVLPIEKMRISPEEIETLRRAGVRLPGPLRREVERQESEIERTEARIREGGPGTFPLRGLGAVAMVTELARMTTSFVAGHDHEAILFLNGDRITGWTTEVRDHFHVFDFPIGILGETEIETSPALQPLHVHTIAEPMFPSRRMP